MTESANRRNLTRWLKAAGWLVGLAAVYVLLDFAIDLRPAGIHGSYRFTIGALDADRPVILQQDNLLVVVIRRSPATIDHLRRAGDNLQDPESRHSRQPDYARNPLRSRQAEYFVAIALGTHLGCPLRVDGDLLLETCSDARYDFAGRSLEDAAGFDNLAVPDYAFTDQYRTLTVRP